jgi:hypothetical protein
MLAKVVVLGFVVVAVVVISVISIVMSTSKGSDWSEAVWKSLDDDQKDKES